MIGCVHEEIWDNTVDVGKATAFPPLLSKSIDTYCFLVLGY